MKSIIANEITVSQQICPPSWEPFVSLGDGGVLTDWAARNPSVYDERTPHEVECLVRGAVGISSGAVGGAISVAKIDGAGLVWVEGKRGACQTGPHEQRGRLMLILRHAGSRLGGVNKLKPADARDSNRTNLSLWLKVELHSEHNNLSV